MPTDCSADLFGFASVEGRRVEAGFDGGKITSDAGALLLGLADRAIGLVGRFAACFVDGRCPELIEHEVRTLVGQRVFGLALGYEDLNDHDWLRHDPVLAVLAGKLAARRRDCAPMAGKSTLNRLELSRPEPTRYHKIGHDPAAIEALLVDVFLEAHDRPPEEIVLDLDATDDPIHGDQEGRFFHGYLRQLLLPAAVRVLRSSSAAPPSCGAPTSTARPARSRRSTRIVGQIRSRWPEVRIVLRADSGFAREPLMAWCEQNARRLPVRPGAQRAPGRGDRGGACRGGGGEHRKRRAGAALQGLPVDDARQLEPPPARRRQGRAHPGRGQSPLRRHLAWAASGPTPARSTKTSTARAARWRTASRNASSTSSPTAPRPPPCAPISCACGSPRWPMCCSKRCAASGCAATKLADATCGSIRLKLLKIGALVRLSVRRVKIAMASAHPWRHEWGFAYAALGAAR